MIVGIGLKRNPAFRRLPRLGAGVWVFALVLFLAAVPGCAPQVGVQGVVYNIKGEALPGVSVRVEALGAFSVSNGNGIFGKRPNTLSLPPGTWEVAYFKTGFTTVRQTIATGDVRSLEVPAVQLWPLPSAKGVYVLDGLTYLPFTRVSPERHLRENNTPVFGMKLTPELKLKSAPPLIISHRMANYDWQLSRLEQVTVYREGFGPPAASEKPGDKEKAKAEEKPREGEDSHTETIWAASVRLPIQAAAIDEPEQQLWRITPSVELGPGIYALHWGALDGDPGTDPSAYLLEVLDPNAPPETEAVEPEEPEAESQDDEVPEEVVDTDEAPAADSPRTQ